MARQLLYLIGQPGAGKSTLLANALSDVPGEPERRPIAHTRYPGGVQLGGAREGFPGTDALSLNVQPIALAWLLGPEAPATVVAEGDRLANGKFWGALRAAGWEVTVVHLAASDELAQSRRDARGSNQNGSWLKGRQTKVRRLAEAWVDPADVLDASLSPWALAQILNQYPVMAALRQAGQSL